MMKYVIAGISAKIENSKNTSIAVYILFLLEEKVGDSVLVSLSLEDNL